jgi:diacylglycerol kinase (ATP)
MVPFIFSLYHQVMKVTLIHNPDAGDDRSPSGDELIEFIHRAGYTVDYQSSKDENWHRVLDEPCDIVAVAGGDGMVGQVAKHVIDKQIPIAVIPMGTANNVAKTLGLTNKTITQVIAGWKAGLLVDFDAGLASGPWDSKCFIEGLGMGLFTETMYRLDARDNVDLAHLNDSGEKVASVLQILKERLRTFTPNKLKITLDGQDLSGQYILLEVMNISYVGPNLCLAPHAHPGDGLLDIVFVSADEQDKLSMCLADSIDSKLARPALTVRKGQRLQIEWDGFTVHIDDEVWPDNASAFPLSPNSIDITVKRHALQFLVSP